jgi:hypothetical protein
MLLLSRIAMTRLVVLRTEALAALGTEKESRHVLANTPIALG